MDKTPQGTNAPKQDTEAPDSVCLTAMSLLDVFVGTDAQTGLRTQLVLTLGDGNGSVQAITLSRRDGRMLLQRLLNNYRAGGVWGEPSRVEQEFRMPFSVRRAKLKHRSEGSEKMLIALRRQMPELSEFVCAELEALSKSLTGKCRTPIAARIIERRLMRAMLVAIDTARIDT